MSAVTEAENFDGHATQISGLIHAYKINMHICTCFTCCNVRIPWHCINVYVHVKEILCVNSSDTLFSLIRNNVVAV